MNNTTVYFANAESLVVSGDTWDIYNIHTFSSAIYYDGAINNFFSGNVSINETEFYSYYNFGLNVYGSSYDSAFFCNDNIYNSSMTLNSPDKSFVFKNDYLDSVSIGYSQTPALLT